MNITKPTVFVLTNGEIELVADLNDVLTAYPFFKDGKVIMVRVEWTTADTCQRIAVHCDGTVQCFGTWHGPRPFTLISLAKVAYQHMQDWFTNFPRADAEIYVEPREFLLTKANGYECDSLLELVDLVVTILHKART